MQPLEFKPPNLASFLLSFSGNQFSRTVAEVVLKDLQPRIAKFIDVLNVEFLSKNARFAGFGAVLRKATASTTNWLAITSNGPDEIRQIEGDRINDSFFRNPNTWQVSAYHDRKIYERVLIYGKGHFAFAREQFRAEIGLRVNEPVGFIKKALRNKPPSKDPRERIRGLP